MAATTTARRSRAARAAEQAKADQQVSAVLSETPKPKPTAEVTVETVQVPYFRPSVKLPDGKVVVCEHKYLHENEKAASACGRRIAAAGAFVK
ncbi:MAG TPA: hypothetical protein VGS19_08115 [Streptosporangiaceae bacterium]|nr:hypothetical protein [Streptosporangiaceae bacterium]